MVQYNHFLVLRNFIKWYVLIYGFFSNAHRSVYYFASNEKISSE